MAKEENVFDGFNELAGTFLMGGEPDYPIRDLENTEDKIEDSLENTKVEDPKKPAKTKKEEVEDKEEEVEEGDEPSEEVIEDEGDGSTESEDYDEEEIVDAFSDLFSKEVGWEFEEGEKPKDIKHLVEYIQELIQENSTPKYSSDEIRELDEFVKNGGDFKEFVGKVHSKEFDPEKVDTTKVDDQKLIIKENLRNRGYSDSRIEKLIDRYEEAGSLEDEALDSLEEVKEYKEKTKKTLLETQKKQHEEQVKQQQAFIKNVEKVIEETNNVAGYTLSDKEKKKLKDDIFKVGSDGLTNAQRAYQSNLRNLVTSAFISLNEDKFKQQIKTKATTDAAKELKLKLKAKGKSTKNTASDQNITAKKFSLWDAANELTSF